MKQRKFNQKLFLNKNTVADLQDDAVQQAKGGAVTGFACTSVVIFCDHRCVTDEVNCPSAPWTNCTAC